MRSDSQERLVSDHPEPPPKSSYTVYAAWLLPLSAALVVALIAPQLFFAYDITPKIAILLLGVSAALVVLGHTSDRTWQGVLLLWNSRRGRLFLILLAAQILSLIVSTVLSSHPGLSLNGSIWRRFGLVIQLAAILYCVLLAAQSVLDPKQPLRFLKATTIAGAVAGIYGIFQYFGIDPILPPNAYHVGESIWTIVRPPATLGHAGYFATFLLYSVFGAFALRAMEKSRAWRLACAIAAIIGSIAIVLSGTRSAVLGLVFGAILVAVWQRPRFRTAHLIALLAIVSAAALFYYSPAGEKLRGRAKWSSEDKLGGSRLMLWRDSVRMAGARWAVGFGPESFVREFPRYQSRELARAYPNFYQESPHNFFLDALTSQGAIGLVILIAFSAAALLNPAGIPIAVRPIAAGFAAALIGQQFIAFTLPTALYFYAFAALLMSTGNAAFVPKRPRSVLVRPIAWAAAAILTLFAIRLSVADVWFAREKAYLNSGGDPGLAAQAQVSAQRWQLPGSSYDLYFSRAWLQFSEKQHDPAKRFQAWQHAMAAALRAERTAEDHANALVNLAAFRAGMNDAVSVERTLKEAGAYAPSWFRPHWLLARFYLVTGRIQEAEAEARMAIDRNAGHSPEVQQTLDQVLAAKSPS